MKSKKLLLGSLSAMALVATPIAAVISCDNDKASTDADKKATFQAADLIREIKKGDEGFAVVLPGSKGQNVIYVSKDDAAKETTIHSGLGSTIKFPKLTAGTTGLKATKTMTDEHFKELKDQINNDPKLNDAQKTAKIAAQKKEIEVVITSIKPVTVGNYVVNKHTIMPDVTKAATAIKGLLNLSMKNGKEIYKFEFTPASLQTTTPVLTTESDVAFKKIFTDLGITVTGLEFAKASKEISIKTLTVKKAVTQPVVTPSKQTDLTALKTALGNTIAVTRAGSGTRITSADVSFKAKGDSMTPDQFLAKLKGLIGGTSHIDPITTLVSGKIKDDMVITFSITKLAVAEVPANGSVAAVPAADGTAVIKINADSLNEVTVPVTFTFA